MPRITPEITENPLILVNGIVLLALTVLTAVFISLYASKVYKGTKKKAVLFFTVIAAFTALSLFCFFGCAATTVKGIIFCLLLAFSSYEDIKTRECENYVHLMIVIAAFIGTDMSALPGMLLSALISQPFETTVSLTRETIPYPPPKERAPIIKKFRNNFR